MRKGAAGRSLLLFLLSSLLGGGCERPEVQATTAGTGAVESTATSVEAGLVKARRDSTLSAPVSGRIVEIALKEGDRLKAGDAIVRLENDLERIAFQEARVELDRALALGGAGAEAQAALDRARFAMERAQVNLERTFVRAPFDGVLVELNANLGEMSYGTMPLNLVMGGKGGGEKPLARVIDDSQLYVEADIDEADAGRLKPGQSARITVEALGAETFSGRLARVSPAISTAEGKSRTVQVEIEIDGSYNSQPGANGAPAWHGLMVGMSADIEIILERVEGVVKVPTLVILEGEEEKTVYVVEDGRIRRRRVQVGASNWEFSEIKDGLRDGELVVIPTDRRELVEGREVRVERREESPRP